MTNVLKPAAGIFRTVFLYVGQGDATLMMVPDGDGHKFVLIDSNKDEENNGVDIVNLLKDGILNGDLIFINTHPHKDHLKSIDDVHRTVAICEVWHSGHLPHKDNREEYSKMQKIISEIGDKNQYYLRGSNDENTVHTDREEKSNIDKKIGDVNFHVFSPAEYVCEEIDGEDIEARRKHIHEQCGVIKFSYKDKSILITGDSDKEAWVEHITPYHGNALKADILSASHHGSRSFFKNGKDDKEPYEQHIEIINPEYLVISAPPKGKDSKFDHPHDDAMEIYKKYISEENIFNLGENKQSLMVDIDSNGNISTEWVDISGEDESQDQDKSASLYPYRPASTSNVRPFCAV
jgi:beta-lactamase superfamily II metal-dependent hydrolase